MSEAQTITKKKIGKIEVEFKKNGNKVDAIIDGTKLDTFKDMKEAEKGAKDYLELIGK